MMFQYMNDQAITFIKKNKCLFFHFVVGFFSFSQRTYTYICIYISVCVYSHDIMENRNTFRKGKIRMRSNLKPSLRLNGK